jgi:hypothetical protein
LLIDGCVKANGQKGVVICVSDRGICKGSAQERNKQQGTNIRSHICPLGTALKIGNEDTLAEGTAARPVLLTDLADFETWLSGSTEDAFALARSYAADQMRIVQSGSERNDLLAA